MWCLKAKKLKFLIEFLDGTKKVQLAGKKSPASRQKKFPKGLEDLAPIFGKLSAPYVMIEIKITQILNWILRWHEKSTASRQKKYS
jgi:hypothetical protein